MRVAFHQIHPLLFLSSVHLNKERNVHNQVLSFKIGIWKWNIINIHVSIMNSDKNCSLNNPVFRGKHYETKNDFPSNP